MHRDLQDLIQNIQNPEDKVLYERKAAHYAAQIAKYSSCILSWLWSDATQGMASEIRRYGHWKLKWKTALFGNSGNNTQKQKTVSYWHKQ